MAGKTPLFAGLLTVLGLGAFYLLWSAPAEVAVVAPKRGPAVEAVYATGTVEPEIMLPVAPRVSGRLVELQVDEGAKVTEGQMLARLEDRDLRDAVEEAQARATLARQEYDRWLVLAERDVISRQTLERAKAELDAATASLSRSEASLDYMQLHAPGEGTIIRRDGEVGQFLSAGEAIFWLASSEDLRISVEVDEEDIATVTPGQKVLIRADAFAAEVFTGSVSQITPKGDPVARSYRVRIALEPGSKLMIGMTAEANIILREEKNALLLPLSALSGERVFVLDGEELIPREVVVGARGNGLAEIREGLAENALVARNAAGLPEGAVKPVEEDWEIE